MNFASHPRVDAWLIWLSVLVLGLSAVFAQLVLTREMLSAFHGNEMVLGIVLGSWFLWTGAGAWLGRLGGRRFLDWRSLIVGQWLISWIPLLQILALRILKNVVFTPGAAVGPAETIQATLVLLLPFCLISGFMLTLAFGLLANQAGLAGLADVYAADSLGSIAGGLLFSVILVQLGDHIQLLYLPASLNLACASLLCFHKRSHPACALILLTVCVLGFVAMKFDLDAWSTQRQFPGQRILFHGNSPYGRLIATEMDGQINLYENEMPASTQAGLQEAEENAHFPLFQRSQLREVLLVGGGFSRTAQEILKHPVDHLTCVELDPVLLQLRRQYFPASFADPRLRVVNTDGRWFLQNNPQRYDAVILDLPSPTTAQLNRFFTYEFFQAVRKSLNPDGLLSFSVGLYENSISPDLARTLAAVYRTTQLVFSNVVVLPASRVFFLASDTPLNRNIQSLAGWKQIPTHYLSQSYLAAMLSPDRLADMDRAVGEPAAINQDGNPILYFYSLWMWMNEFKYRLGWIEALLLVFLAFFVLKLKAHSLALFTSGFSASALQFILLLGYQLRFGSIYHHLGFMVAMFMAGLALGSIFAKRLAPGGEKTQLTQTVFLLAGLAVLIPWGLNFASCGLFSGSLTTFAGLVFYLLTLAVGATAGMQFPLASRWRFKNGAETGSELYSADLLGASLGALFSGALLVPLLGFVQVCLVVALLNCVTGLILFRSS